jgi:hypothetical protein
MNCLKPLRSHLAPTFFALLVGWALFLPPASPAVTFQPLSIETLSRQADLVLHGTVLSKTVQRDDAGRIFTAIELQVTEIWKGAIGNNPFLIVQGGGVLGEEEVTVSGQVHYQVGEEVVVFLTRNPRGAGVTLGMIQAKFQVWQDPQTGTKLVGNPFHDAAASSAPRTSSKNSAIPPSTAGVLTISDLKQRVQEAGR